MFNEARILGLYAETPLHPGSGATAGVVDLPVQRERHTNFPLISGPSLKGVLRDLMERKYPPTTSNGKEVPDQRVIDIFGPRAGDLHGGALSITDARLLLFPARSLEGMFVWITCPFALERLQRDLKSINGNGLTSVPNNINPGQAIRGTNSGLKGTSLILEEFNFDWLDEDDKRRQVDSLITLREAGASGPLTKLLPEAKEYKSFVERLARHLVVISDQDFTHLVTHATEVVTRIRLNKRKTTTGDGGNMWVEELLPSDCVFYALALAMPPRSGKTNGTIKDADGVLECLADIKPTLLQVGGDETVGRGWMRVRLWDGKADQEGTK
jgi:CRISPR-associated protein Cmr4